MNNEVGVWIDHSNAVIVMRTGETEEITRIASNVQRHVEHIGKAQMDVGDDQCDKRFVGHLNKYYDAVISHIRDAKSIMIFGPGEAKGEFVKRLRHEHLGENIVSVDTVDKMTDRQLASRVRDRFEKLE